MAQGTNNPVPASPESPIASHSLNPIYSALPKSLSGQSKTIRMLKIHPGLPHASIECSLSVVNLETLPRFEALSYVWGNPHPPSTILCDGHPQSVTPNLAVALRHLRLPHMIRNVWIDAICVNQDNLKERSQQVRLMSEIYSLAWRVVVWLGEDDNSLATMAIETINWFVKDCCSTIRMELDDIDLSSGSDSDEKIRNVYPMTEAMKLPAPIQTPDEWKALEWFFERPWSSRIWVIQEVAFAPALIYIGSYEIGWKEVAIAATWDMLECETSSSTRARQYTFSSGGDI